MTESQVLEQTRVILNRMEKQQYRRLSEAGLLGNLKMREFLLEFLYGPAKKTFSSNTLVLKLIISLWAVSRKLRQVPKDRKLLFWAYVFTIIAYSLALIPAINMKPFWARVIKTIAKITYRFIPRTSFATRIVGFIIKYTPNIIEFMINNPVAGLVISLFSGVLSGILFVFAEGLKYISGASLNPTGTIDKILERFTIKGKDYINLYRRFINNLATHLMKINAVFNVLFSFLRMIYTRLVSFVDKTEKKVKQEIDKERRNMEEESIQEADEDIPDKKDIRKKDIEGSLLSKILNLFSKIFNYIVTKTIIGNFIGVFLWAFFGSNKIGKKLVRSFPPFKRIYVKSVMKAKPFIKKIKLREAIQKIKEFIQKIIRFVKFKKNIASTEMK